MGLCLEDESPPAGERPQPCAHSPQAGRQASSWQRGLCVCSLVAPALDEAWPGLDAALPEPDGASPECAETSSVAEISSHVCESFFMSPESTLEWEQPVRRVYRSLGLAVDGLLEMVLDSTRQVRRGPSASLCRGGWRAEGAGGASLGRGGRRAEGAGGASVGDSAAPGACRVLCGQGFRSSTRPCGRDGRSSLSRRV